MIRSVFEQDEQTIPQSHSEPSVWDFMCFVRVEKETHIMEFLSWDSNPDTLVWTNLIHDAITFKPEDEEAIRDIYPLQESDETYKYKTCTITIKN